jgi:hypothetical protein
MKNYKNKNQAMNIIRKKTHKKCKPKFNPKLKTQRHKVRTRYMLKDDSTKFYFDNV